MADTTHVTAPDGVRLQVEVEGSGPALLLLHEVAGTLRSWDPQVAALRERFTCVRYDARGYGGSDVPRDPAAYGQQVAVADALAVLDGLGLDRVAAVGFSMGGFCLLHAMMQAPQRFGGAVVVGVGYGSHPDDRPVFQAEMRAAAQRFRDDPVAAAVAYADGPTRRQLLAKAPDRWAALRDGLAAHHPVGQALTFSEVLGQRPSLYDYADRLAALDVPTLLVVGDEDDGCLETNLMLKRAMPWSGLAVLPRTGHTPNLEDPEDFNALVAGFLERVAAGGWGARAAGSTDRGLVGMS